MYQIDWIEVLINIPLAFGWFGVGLCAWFMVKDSQQPSAEELERIANLIRIARLNLQRLRFINGGSPYQCSLVYWHILSIRTRYNFWDRVDGYSD
ncbi:hypothetical protein DAE87_004578 [Salmonella enterica subsp. enterica serovar Braenderup]|nr:hypothetical protein [Salmonella enterica]EDX8731918.1 hypothetical protein [Salmonella enterica subsp. enterica serovar Braenderup]EIE0653047.1 hypothetical protein [Salmonella enterica]EIX3308886.1 hypothetical protein [Salmonella enterica]ELG0460757.1 hypothetical protein [Salmonella enterica]